MSDNLQSVRQAGSELTLSRVAHLQRKCMYRKSVKWKCWRVHVRLFRKAMLASQWIWAGDVKVENNTENAFI